MDKRIGKRSLVKLKMQIEDLPDWLQFIYQLRFESEKV